MARKRNVENRRAWIAALRSGKYKQTMFRLYRSKKNAEESGERAGYCCLGVACRIAGVKPAKLNGKGMPEEVEGFDLTEWLGLPRSTPLLDKAAGWNDGANMSFKEIADELERELLRKSER